MVSYIDRRKRWLRKLLQLDKATHISKAKSYSLHSGLFGCSGGSNGSGFQ